MKDKDIIQETLDKLTQYKVETPHDGLFNIFTDEFKARNEVLNKNKKDITGRNKIILTYLFIIALVAFLAPYPFNICNAICCIILGFLCTLISEYLIIKRKQTLLHDMDEYAEFIMNLFLDHNLDYYDRNINSSSWEGFLKRCHNYCQFAISMED